MQVLIGYNNPQCSECLNPLVRESTNIEGGYIVMFCGRICTSFLCPHTNPKDCKYTCKNFGINLEIPFIRLEVKERSK